MPFEKADLSLLGRRSDSTAQQLGIPFRSFRDVEANTAPLSTRTEGALYRPQSQQTESGKAEAAFDNMPKTLRSAGLKPKNRSKLKHPPVTSSQVSKVSDHKNPRPQRIPTSSSTLWQGDRWKATKTAVKLDPSKERRLTGSFPLTACGGETPRSAIIEQQPEPKTPITPPLAYTDFLKALSPIATSPIKDESKELKLNSALTLSLLQRKPSHLRRLRIPNSPIYTFPASDDSSIQTMIRPPSRLPFASHLHSPFLPADWTKDSATRKFSKSPQSEPPKISVRHVVTRTVTYKQRPSFDFAPNGNGDATETEGKSRMKAFGKEDVMFITSTISEDRSGGEADFVASRLAYLGLRDERRPNFR